MTEPWYFEEVVYDSYRAEMARDALAGAAASLSEALQLVERDIPVIVEDWHGPARATFDPEMRSLLEAGHQLVATLVGGVSAVAYHAEMAMAEDRRRRALRDQWGEDRRLDLREAR